jgi:hypothetical protein
VRAKIRYAGHKKTITGGSANRMAHATTSTVAAAIATHQNRKSRRSRLMKWPVMVFEAGGHRVRETGPTVEE